MGDASSTSGGASSTSGGTEEDSGLENSTGLEDSGLEDSTGAETGSEVTFCTDLTLDVSACDLESASFTLESTNPYYPLVPNTFVFLEGQDEDDFIRIERRVLDEVEEVAGVMTHILEHREYINGELYEVARNFYVESTDGVVCYFGEDVEFYEGGEVINNDGTWRVGVDGNPGIIMPAEPTVGQAYLQENAPGIALDMGEVVETGATVTLGETEYTDVVTVIDTNPLEACDTADPKRYAPGLGEVADVDVVLIESGTSP